MINYKTLNKNELRYYKIITILYIKVKIYNIVIWSIKILIKM
jgi:hypothetical protein